MLPKQIRVDVQPLLDYLQATYSNHQANLALDAPLTQGYMATLLGTHRAQIQRAQREGLVIWRADAWCVALGLHPAEIWTDWYELDEVAA